MKKIILTLEKKWFILPCLSAFFLIFSFYPFNIPFLSFVALVPLFYFTFFLTNLSNWKLFGGGFLVGFLFSTSISFFSLMQFHWLPEAHFFTSIVHSLFLPIASITGAISGLLILFIKKIKHSKFIYNIVVFASLWTLFEWLVFISFSGFHMGLLAYTVNNFPILMSFAGIGGIFLVSFIIVIINIFITAFLFIITSQKTENRTILQKEMIGSFLIFIIIMTSIYLINSSYLSDDNKQISSIRIAIIQDAEREESIFGEFKNEIFYFERLEEILKETSINNPDVIVYPFAPFDGVLSIDKNPGVVFNKNILVGDKESFGQWLKGKIQPEVVFITWNSVFRDGEFYNEYNFWKNGELINYYQKRGLFAFMDYTPQWSQKVGIFSTPFDVSPGEDNQTINLNGIVTGNLLCSEVSKQELARKDSLSGVDIFFAIGSEAMFKDSVAGQINIISAQFRAIENNHPIVRANKFGPSAIIDNHGKELGRLEFNEKGILVKDIKYTKEAPKTLYTQTGNSPFIVLLTIFVLIGIFRKFKYRKLKTP